MVTSRNWSWSLLELTGYILDISTNPPMAAYQPRDLADNEAPSWRQLISN